LACGILKNEGKGYGIYVAALGGVLLTGWAVHTLKDTWAVLSSLGEYSELSPYTTLLLKALGVGYVVKIASDVCRDLGAQETAQKIELCGKAELLLMAMPLVMELVSLALHLTSESL
jgi:stage III sporulation protein AD